MSERTLITLLYLTLLSCIIFYNTSKKALGLVNIEKVMGGSISRSRGWKSEYNGKLAFEIDKGGHEAV